MPTTPSFIACGTFDGFASRPVRYDVDAWDDWITLGGFRKGDVGPVTEQQINDSLKAAMKFYWMLYAAQVHISVTTLAETPGISISPSLTIGSGQYIDNTDPVAKFPTPPQRARTAFPEVNEYPKVIDPTAELSEGYEEIFDGVSITQSASVRIEGSATTSKPFYDEIPDIPRLPRVISMYLGGEFIGYGLRGPNGFLTTPSAPSFAESLRGFVQVGIIVTNPPDGNVKDVAHDNLTLLTSGIPAFADIFTGMPNRTFTTTEVVVNGAYFLHLVATNTNTTETGDQTGLTASYTVNTTFTNLDFYTVV